MPIVATTTASLDTPTSLKTAPRTAVEPVECRCSQYLRERRGIAIRGNADTIRPNITPGDAGISDVIIFSYKNGDHVAEIIGYTEKGWLVHESNYSPCKITERDISMRDPAIRGFYRPAL
jgi:hypothetical protein